MPLIYGIHPVREAMLSGQIERLVIEKDHTNARLTQLVVMARERGIEVRTESRSRMDAMCSNNPHQGAAAYVMGREAMTMDDLVEKSGETPLFLVLDGIEDPHNLGAILRVADGAGCHGVFLPKRRSCPITDTVIKVSAGAAQHVHIARVPNIHQLLEFLQKHNIWVVGTDVNAEKLWYEVDFTGPVAIVVGREGEGMHQLVRRHCDELVRLPMCGAVQSLNVSVSTGIMVYEALRQRQVK